MVIFNASIVAFLKVSLLLMQTVTISAQFDEYFRDRCPGVEIFLISLSSDLYQARCFQHYCLFISEDSMQLATS
uniref:Secreted protein n=1 Tax=Parascaris univalens TaxID=6257 RepID=A0A914ZGI8_PARUN